MSKVQRIEEEIEGLSSSEYDELRSWFIARDAETWDEDFESDVKAGKLDALGDAARRAHGSGETKPL